MVAGDAVYIRAGTYGVGDYLEPADNQCVKPSNSGTNASTRITYSGYGDEEVIFTGTKYRSRAIHLSGKNYIKVTKLIFQNMGEYLWIISGGSYNEVSYCTLRNMRDVWSDLYSWGSGQTIGTHTGANGATVLTHADDGTAAGYWGNKRLLNRTTGSACYTDPSTSTSIPCYVGYPMWGGIRGGIPDNTWNTGDEYSISQMISWGGSYIYQNATHNWIHHNTFHHYGGYTWNDEGVILELGVGSESSTDQSNNNTIENNEFYAGGHHVLGVNTGKYQVIRSNYVHNESWWAGPVNSPCRSYENGVCGYRVISANANVTYGGTSLWENNRVGYGAQYGGPHPTTGASGSGTSLATSNNIYRYNSHFGNALYGLRFGSSLTAGVSNRTYNNTFYHNGYGADDDPYAAADYRGGINYYGGSCPGGITEDEWNVVKNTLFHDHWSTTATPRPYPALYKAGMTSCAKAENNFNPDLVDVDPKFVNPDITTPSSTTLPNLTLQSSSPAIDGGTYLTQANGSGSNSTTLIVDDAKYFQDGAWGSDLARSNLYADWIAIGTVSNVVQISSIDYANNKITLASPKSWSDNAPIWLYKKSDGTIVLYGSAPDYGAHEYNVMGIYPLLPPKGLRIVE